MFGPRLTIDARSRIYRRRLAYAHVAAAGLLGVALFTVHYAPDPYEPPARPGYLGEPLIVEKIDELREEVAPVELLAGGHPLPSALEAVEVDLELTHEEPDILVEPAEGDAEQEVPEIEEPRPGPEDRPELSDRNAAPLSIRSEKVVILKFVKPPYPADARLLGIEGRVSIWMLVGRDGLVKEAIPKSDDNLLPSCVRAAKLAAEKWKFSPILVAGEPQEFWVEVAFNFALDGGVRMGT